MLQATPQGLEPWSRSRGLLVFKTSSSSSQSSAKVPVVGLEPTRAYAPGILSPMRLPFRHTGILSSTPGRIWTCKFLILSQTPMPIRPRGLKMRELSHCANRVFPRSIYLLYLNPVLICLHHKTWDKGIHGYQRKRESFHHVLSMIHTAIAYKSWTAISTSLL